MRLCSAAIASRGKSCQGRRCLRKNAQPDRSDFDDAMSGNICRCGTYSRIRAAIKQAAQSIESGRLTMIFYLPIRQRF